MQKPSQRKALKAKGSRRAKRAPDVRTPAGPSFDVSNDDAHRAAWHLTKAFTWSDTPEGHRFWSNVSARLCAHAGLESDCAFDRPTDPLPTRTSEQQSCEAPKSPFTKFVSWIYRIWP